MPGSRTGLRHCLGVVHAHPTKGIADVVGTLGGIGVHLVAAILSDKKETIAKFVYDYSNPQIERIRKVMCHYFCRILPSSTFLGIGIG